MSARCWKWRRSKARLRSFEAAHAEHCRREAAYIAALPARMAAIADNINHTYAHLLPPGVRFEWGERDGVA